MKFLFLAFVLVIVHHSEQQPPPESAAVEAFVEECMKTNNVDASIVESAFKQGKFIEDNNFKCFLKCIFVKMGDMTEDGKLNIDEIKKQAPPGATPEQISTIVDKCKDATGADPCDTAYKVAKCLMEEASKLFPSG